MNITMPVILNIASVLIEANPESTDVIMDFVIELDDVRRTDRDFSDALSHLVTDRIMEGIQSEADIDMESEPRPITDDAKAWWVAFRDRYGTDQAYAMIVDVVDCTYCGRDKGHLCETDDSNVSRRPHARRIVAAWRHTHGALI